MKTDASPPPKKDKICLEMLETHKKSCLITSNWQKICLNWELKISFLAIPMLTSQKLLQKWGSGQKCCFFVTKMVILKS